MTESQGMETRKPTTALYPTPIVLVTCVDGSQRPNIITLAWAGVVCSEPPQIGISIRPGRHSHPIIEKTGQFVVAIPCERVLRDVDLCGNVSGRDVDKFGKTNLTPKSATKVSPPLIAECPVNMECLVRHRISLGSHDLFIGEVVAVHIDRSVLTEKGLIDFDEAKLIAYGNGEYRGLGKLLERQGFSIRQSPRVS